MQSGSNQSSKPRPGRFIYRLGLALTGTLALLTLVGFGGGALSAMASPQAWLPELFSHFRLQYFLLQVLLLPFFAWCLWRRRNRLLTAILLFPALLANGLVLLPYLTPHVQGTQSNQISLRLLHLNVYAPNRQYQTIAETIRRYDPDLVELMEYDEDSRQGLEATGVLAKYPYRLTGQAHLGLYSRLPLAEASYRYIAAEKVANNVQIVARLVHGSKPLTLIAAHPHIPLAGNLARQRRHFDTWIAERKQYDEQVVLMGDFNTTPWSAGFQRLIAGTGLVDTQIMHGLQPSWPMFLPQLGPRGKWPIFQPLYALLRIPIDHVLVSPAIYIKRRETGPYVGSDHLPVFVELGLAP